MATTTHFAVAPSKQLVSRQKLTHCEKGGGASHYCFAYRTTPAHGKKLQTSTCPKTKVETVMKTVEGEKTTVLLALSLQQPGQSASVQNILTVLVLFAHCSGISNFQKRQLRCSERIGAHMLRVKPVSSEGSGFVFDFLNWIALELQLRKLRQEILHL
jgi:hypothetical protein